MTELGGLTSKVGALCTATAATMHCYSHMAELGGSLLLDLERRTECLHDLGLGGRCTATATTTAPPTHPPTSAAAVLPQHLGGACGTEV